MAATPPSNSKPGDDRKATPAPLTFEDNLNQFWQKNRMIVLGLCVLVLVAILGKGIWERMQRQKELDIEAAYASATTPDQLHAFISAHPDHELAGIAQLRVADEAYSSGKPADAVAAYDKALSVLKTGPLAARAQLGRAMAKVQSGKASEGEADLKQLLNDGKQLKAVRAEAAYDLASLSSEAGNAAEVQKYVEQLNQIDPASMWARRAMMLQSALPKPSTPAPAATAAPAADQKSAPSVQIKVPGK